MTGGKDIVELFSRFQPAVRERGFQRIYERAYRVDAYATDFRCERSEMEKAYRACTLSGSESAYIESVEGVTINTIGYFFNLLLANENLHIARQNLENADKLYEIAIAKRKIGHISESELMQLKLSALQMKGKLTEAQSGLNANMFQLRAFWG